MRCVWVACGVFYRGQWKGFVDILKAMLTDYPNLFISLTPELIAGELALPESFAIEIATAFPDRVGQSHLSLSRRLTRPEPPPDPGASTVPMPSVPNAPSPLDHHSVCSAPRFVATSPSHPLSISPADRTRASAKRSDPSSTPSKRPSPRRRAQRRPQSRAAVSATSTLASCTIS